MKVTRTTTDLETYLTHAGLAVQGERADRTAGPGVTHLSDIYGELNKVVNPQKDMGGRDIRVYRVFGFIWERVMAEIYRAQDPERYQCLGEFECDGITGSPDILDIATCTVIDCKATWKSMSRLANLERDFFAWLCQNKGYCKMLGWQAGRLVIFFVNGDYKDSGPQIVTLDLAYSAQEIEENWAMVVGHARRTGRI